MRDDNPLWYDYTEQDEPPGRGLLILAALFGVVVSLASAMRRIVGWIVERRRTASARLAVGRLARRGRRF